MVRNIFLILGFVLFTAAGAGSQSLSESGRQEGTAAAGRQKPVVNIQEQPGAPMRISTLQTKWATPAEQGLEIHTVVENVSEAEIRAYAWRVSLDGVQNVDGCLLHNVNLRGKILRPGDSDGKTTWRAIPPDSPSINIELSMDFVEFTNGTTWGLDVCQSAERLSGLRAGGVAAREKLVRLLDQNNGRALANMLKLTPPMLDAPDGHSPVWVKGFHGGVSGFFNRVKEANYQGGLPEAERVLRLPIDASEDR